MINKIPKPVLYLMSLFEKSKYEIYIVGGAVRDLLLNKEPKDYDLATNALPEEMIEVANNFNIRYIPTGLKHGTITFLVESTSIEVTTYRIDGDYSDNRHPDSVTFTDIIEKDLSRRDLTINAIALSSKGVIKDPFGGAIDLKDKVIRCVGDPDKRFEEDGLRMLRAYRFASQLSFKVDINRDHFDKNLNLLRNISNERIRDELNKFVMGDNIVDNIEMFISMVAVKVPELMLIHYIKLDSKEKYQNNIIHTARLIEKCPKVLSIRLAALFHDINICSEVLHLLKYSNSEINELVFLINNIDSVISSDEVKMKQLLYIASNNNVDISIIDNLIELQYAHSQIASYPVIDREYSLALKNYIISNNICYSLKQLAIDGRDLKEAGYNEGPIFSYILIRCLHSVINNEVENNKELLLQFIRDDKDIQFELEDSK